MEQHINSKKGKMCFTGPYEGCGTAISDEMAMKVDISHKALHPPWPSLYFVIWGDYVSCRGYHPVACNAMVWENKIQIFKLKMLQYVPSASAGKKLVL